MTRSPKTSSDGSTLDPSTARSTSSGDDTATSEASCLGESTQTTTCRSDSGIPEDAPLTLDEALEHASACASDLTAHKAELGIEMSWDMFSEEVIVFLADEVKRLRSLNRSFGATVGKMIVSLNRDRNLPDDVAHLVKVIRQELEKALHEHSVGEAKP